MLKEYGTVYQEDLEKGVNQSIKEANIEKQKVLVHAVKSHIESGLSWHKICNQQKIIVWNNISSLTPLACPIQTIANNDNSTS